jgi:hypothetical protein
MKKSQELTLRDYYASCALASLSNMAWISDEQKKLLAKACYEMADAMLEERNKEKA